MFVLVVFAESCNADENVNPTAEVMN